MSNTKGVTFKEGPDSDDAAQRPKSRVFHVSSLDGGQILPHVASGDGRTVPHRSKEEKRERRKQRRRRERRKQKAKAKAEAEAAAAAETTKKEAEADPDAVLEMLIAGQGGSQLKAAVMALRADVAVVAAAVTAARQDAGFMDRGIQVGEPRCVVML
jgi:hypothetical protein